MWPAVLAALGATAAVALLRPMACIDAAVRLGLAAAGVRSRRGRAGGLDLHWFERPGREPALVLLHGLGASAERWFPILPSLLPGRRLLAPSLPAHGSSAAPAAPFGVVEVAWWIRQWLDVAGAGGAIDLLGFSLGGWVAAHLALAEPARVRRLVLASSAGVRFDPPPPRHLLAPESLSDAQRLVACLTFRPLHLPRFVLRDLLRRSRPERRWLAESALRGEGLLAGELARLRAPTLVVWGAEDRLIPPAAGRELVARIPGARGVELAGCGHLPYWERRREFQSLVEEFLG